LGPDLIGVVTLELIGLLSHRNRYLILDVLGQGTFGQVVKCQNLKTQEVVAVKVVKNRTAYFNQSMMEVSVLDLVNPHLQRSAYPFQSLILL
jgi:dual specificity protein kinase YAK1